MKKQPQNDKIKKGILEKASETLDLPKNLTMQLPRLIFTGHRELYIENFRGIAEYGDSCIRIATQTKQICICGRALAIKCIAAEEITLEGEIESVTFEGGV